MRIFLEAESYQIVSEFTETFHHSLINQTNGFANKSYLAA